MKREFFNSTRLSFGTVFLSKAIAYYGGGVVLLGILDPVKSYQVALELGLNFYGKKPDFVGNEDAGNETEKLNWNQTEPVEMAQSARSCYDLELIGTR